MIYGDRNNSIGENLKKLREDSGFSQKQIADAIHVDRSTYTNYELGKICPPLNMIYRLAKAFDVDYTEILEGDMPKRVSVADSGAASPQYPSKTYELSAKEQELVLRYRMMTAEDQLRLYDQLRELARKKHPYDDD